MIRQLGTIAVLMAALPLMAAAHAFKSDGYRYSPDSRISHHGRPHGGGGHNASVFCDRVTATGGMSCGAMQFAHRTLPLGSWHTLCNRICVRARVVDRGPAAWTGRSYDLAPGLARALGINGLGNVSLR